MAKKTLAIRNSQDHARLTPVGGNKNLAPKICLSPFIMVSIQPNGSVSLCGCWAWQPSSVGNVFHDTLPNILANEYSRAIRASIISGSYEYCDDSKCGILINDSLNTPHNVPPAVAELLDDSAKWIMPYEIHLAGDETCNLSCPSCRQQVKINTAEEARRNEQIGEMLTHNIFAHPTDQYIKLMVSTSGEIFASPLLLKFVSGISVQDFPNLHLHLQTNGLLAPQRWHRLGDMQQRVSRITVTIDAATAGTYERLRRGGRWSDIVEAMTWIGQKKRENGMQLHTRMVVQSDNWREIEQFYHDSVGYGADMIEYTRILDWGTMGQQGFREADVLDPRHADFSSARNALRQIQNWPGVHFMGGAHPDQIT